MSRSAYAGEFGIAWRIIKKNLNIPTPPTRILPNTTATSHSPKCNWITWGNIILIPLGVLERHTITTSDMLVTKGIIKTKAFDRFLEGFFVIEGQPHLNPNQNYRWCDALAK